MSIRTLGRAMAAAVAWLLAGGAMVHAQQQPAVRNIVLVHGAWADGGSWQDVHRLLRARGYAVSVVQNPLSSLADDVASTRRVLDRQDGPTLLVGHSYGGAVISEAGSHERIAGIVYVAAFMPDAGESVAALTASGSPPPLRPSRDGYLFFEPSIFPQAFAQDLPAERGAFLADSQKPVAGAAFAAAASSPAWRMRPVFYVVPTEDRIIPPAAQRHWAARANAVITELRGSHAIYISQPEAVADVIDRAARAVSR
ncbi:alpha/beta fold hydrolase [Neoroseomonas lacus]|nr:alpha/beta hydrolase [Neoroseomonas lacus]